MPNQSSTRRTSSGLSARQLREIRKELLVARASIERMSIVEASTDLSKRLSRFGWLGMLIPGFARRADVGDGSSWLAAMPGFLQPVLQAVLPLLRRHPIGAALASLLLGLPGGSALRRAGSSAKWAGAALMGIKVYRLWHRLSIYRKQRGEKRSAKRAQDRSKKQR